MKGDITQADLVAFMRQELETRQESYPLRVEMGRLSQEDAEKGLALTRAVLAAVLSAGPQAERVRPETVTLKHHREVVAGLEGQLERAVATASDLTVGDKYLAIEPALHQIHICTREHRAMCESCNATAMALDEIFGIKG